MVFHLYTFCFAWQRKAKGRKWQDNIIQLKITWKCAEFIQRLDFQSGNAYYFPALIHAIVDSS